MKLLISSIIIIMSTVCGSNRQGGNTDLLEYSTQSQSIDINNDNNLAQDSVSKFQKKLSQIAIEIIDPTIRYTPDYVSIPYPNGDVPANTGVCTDVIIRAYRKLGIDLQKEVHEDMRNNFSLYPKKWGLKRTDKNIDHRRVPNLEVFFSRHGKKLPITKNPEDYKTGELVTWMINNKMPHIGIVTNQLTKDKKRRLIVHNIGGGQILEDILFAYPITGHFSYEPQTNSAL